MAIKCNIVEQMALVNTLCLVNDHAARFERLFEQFHLSWFSFFSTVTVPAV